MIFVIKQVDTATGQESYEIPAIFNGIFKLDNEVKFEIVATDDQDVGQTFKFMVYPMTYS